jgi:hypothetical protein
MPDLSRKDQVQKRIESRFRKNATIALTGIGITVASSILMARNFDLNSGTEISSVINLNVPWIATFVGGVLVTSIGIGRHIMDSDDNPYPPIK